MRIVIAIACLALGLSAPAPALAQAFNADRVQGSVVMVVVQSPRGTSTGSGFVVAPGVVVTNFHVVRGASRVTVIVNGGSPSQQIPVTEVATAAVHDIAILRAPRLTARPLTIAAGEPALDAPVWAFGFPGLADAFNAEEKVSASLTRGNVSRVFEGRSVPGGSEGTTRLIQHDAMIAPGSSGGPLLDACQRVTGINAQGASRDGDTYRFSIASSVLPEILAADNVRATLSRDGCGATPASSKALPKPKDEAATAPPADAVGPTAPAARPDPQDLLAERERRLLQQEARLKRLQAEQAAAARRAAAAPSGSPEAAREQRKADAAARLAEELQASSAALRKQIEDSRPGPAERYGPVAGALLVMLGLAALGLMLHLRSRAADRRRRAAEAEQQAISATIEEKRGRDLLLEHESGSLRLPGAGLAAGLVVGRASDQADIVLPRAEVSRRHAHFVRIGNRIEVRDLGSLNGTWINGERLPPGSYREVRTGDRVGFGPDLSLVARIV